MPNDRPQSAYRFRVDAAEVARNRPHPKHQANPDEARYGTACYPMSFTKGLDHDEITGLVANASHFEAFRTAIDNGFAEPFTTRVPVPSGTQKQRRRMWEAPTAGTVFELEGPDPQAVTMPPAPELESDELTFEMAEVYELALLRDVPFAAFDEKSKVASEDLEMAINRLNSLDFAKQNFPGTRGRFTRYPYKLETQTAFRGSSPGSIDGPYVSQFLLIGTDGDPANGLIRYGAQTVDQRVLQAPKGDDYMVDWNIWLNVQRGFDQGSPGQDFSQNKRRLICTPRDLATYVHIDALYQAYLNACLVLLGQKAPFDPSFDLLSGQDNHEILVNSADQQTKIVNAGGFALWGGPHILSLVTEVATRALKAVRYQKFNVHLRLRPEALAARIEKAQEIEKINPSLCGNFSTMRRELDEVGLLDAVCEHNLGLTSNPANTVLLPMAFAEGSPMHPTYGAGHATVAGSCVTMLKAFFDCSAVFVQVVIPKKNDVEEKITAHFFNKSQIKKIFQDNPDAKVSAGAYVPECDENTGDSSLKFVRYGHYIRHGNEVQYKALEEDCCPLTLEGELNKLAANISIGRNMAGVHYFSDYFDSVRMGEEIALGILEEQALGYSTDPFVVSVPTFDGDTVRIGRR